MTFAPSLSSTVQRPDISMALMEYELDKAGSGNIGHQVLPIQEVEQFTGNYGKFEAVEMAQDADSLKRAIGGSYKAFDYKITSANFETEEYGAKIRLDQRFMHSYAYLAGGDADKFRMIAAALAQKMLRLAAEKRVAAAVFNATTFASHTTAITDEWDDYANAVPSEDVAAAKQAMRLKFGKLSNADLVAIMSSRVADNLRLCADVRNSLQYVRPVNQSQITDADIAGALGVGRILIGDEMRPTHAQGAATAAFEDVWDDEYVMIAKLSSPGSLGSIMSPGLGRTFHWRADGSLPDGLVETYFDDDVRAEVVRIRHQTDELIDVVSAGYLLSNATS